MQTQQAKRAQAPTELPRRRQLNRLLLVGSDAAFRNDMTRRVFNGQQFRIAGRSTTLLDALARLESGTIDLVLLSREFHDQELSLFVLDAHRRGFAGLILHVASSTNEIARHASTSGKGVQPDYQSRPSHWQVSPDRQPQLELRDLEDAVTFTAKQQAVLAWVSEGWTNQRIALHLKCSEGSVKAVLQELFKKLGVRKRAQIVRMAFDKTPWSPLNDVHPGPGNLHVTGQLNTLGRSPKV